MFIYLSANKLISKNQSGFQPSDSCISQLLSITHEIFTSYDNGLYVRSVFLDLSKAFDKAWHEGLIFKLKQNGISREFLQILSNFLNNRKQRVVLNGQIRHGTMFMLEFQKDLFYSIIVLNLCKWFKWFTSFFSVVHDVNTSAKELNDDLKKVNDWAFEWKMSFNPDPSKQAQEVILVANQRDRPTRL